MSVPTETLLAYVDGELSQDEARRVEAAIAAAPELHAFVAQQQALRRRLHDSFDALLDVPLPVKLVTAAGQPPSLRWRMTKAMKSLASWRILLWSGVPAAAALACGIVLGMFVATPENTDIVSVRSGLVARGTLAAALTDALSDHPVQMAEAQIGISFRDKTGRYCRTFRTNESSPLAGVACHQYGDWRIAALVVPPVEEGAGASYELAGSAMPDAVRIAVRGMISGPPLDAAAERHARAQGWSGR